MATPILWWRKTPDVRTSVIPVNGVHLGKSHNLPLAILSSLRPRLGNPVYYPCQMIGWGSGINPPVTLQTLYMLCCNAIYK